MNHLSTGVKSIKTCMHTTEIQAGQQAVALTAAPVKHVQSGKNVHS